MSATDTSTTAASGRTALVGGLFALVAAASLAWLGGVVGIAGGVALVGTWWLATPRAAFAVGQVTLVAVSGLLGSLALVGVEGLLFALLVAPSDDTHLEWQVVAGMLTSGLVLGAVWWFAREWNGLWATGLVLLGLVALGAYAIHRYELVAVGQVTADE